MEPWRRMRWAVWLARTWRRFAPAFSPVLMRSALRVKRLSAIVVTHDLAVARLLSHRVMVMKGGRVIETGLTDQVLDDPREPYTQLLVSSILPA